MLNRMVVLLLGLAGLFIASCSSTRKGFDPNRKFAPEKLQKDFTLFRNILEESHPSLYWFTPKDSMDLSFAHGLQQLKDSMTEPAFRNLLSTITSRIRCGHTSMRYSKRYTAWLDTATLRMFPFTVKIWGPDSMAVTAMLNRKDSLLKRGTIITAIDGRNVSSIIDTFTNYLQSDGLIISGKYQMMSNRNSFGNLYRAVYGIPEKVNVNYIDSNGLPQSAMIAAFEPPPTVKDKDRSKVDSSKSLPAPGTPAPKPPKDVPKSVTLNASRNLQIDTTLKSAYMVLNTFSSGNHLRGFFRRSFREIKKREIKHLVVDVRNNGGGDAGNSTLLTKYLSKKKFKLADSLYTNKRSSQYAKHIELQPLYWLWTMFVTHKADDGKFHFGYFERHYYKPKRRLHYDGQVYILTGGNSFSATTLFAKAIQGQPNVTIVGEETGGGAYGNTAWMIPDVTLPNTRIRFRLPRFKLIMDTALVKEGRGIMPDIEVGYSSYFIRRGVDPKLGVVYRIIRDSARIEQERKRP
jgi:hypothetical protein